MGVGEEGCLEEAALELNLAKLLVTVRWAVCFPESGRKAAGLGGCWMPVALCIWNATWGLLRAPEQDDRVWGGLGRRMDAGQAGDGGSGPGPRERKSC